MSNLPGQVLSVQDKLAQFKLQNDARMQVHFNAVKMDDDHIFNMLWNNPDPDLTPQAILTFYGTEASKLFLVAGAVETMLNAIVPGTVTHTPPPCTFNQDGTVTVDPSP